MRSSLIYSQIPLATWVTRQAHPTTFDTQPKALDKDTHPEGECEIVGRDLVDGAPEPAYPVSAGAASAAYRSA